jgi:C4-dicarboxylate transporter DctQ subunit
MPTRPQKVWRTVETWIEAGSRLTGFVGGFAILAAALIVTEGVVSRKVLGVSTIWQIEMSVFLLIYACFVGAALGQKNESHLNVDLLIVYLSPRNRERLLLVVSVLSAVICAVLAYYAWPMWWQSLLENEHSESLWGPPMWIPYFFLPLGMTMLFLQYLVQILRRVQNLRRGVYEKEIVRTELKDVQSFAGDSSRPEADRSGGPGE